MHPRYFTLKENWKLIIHDIDFLFTCDGTHRPLPQLSHKESVFFCCIIGTWLTKFWTADLKKTHVSATFLSTALAWVLKITGNPVILSTIFICSLSRVVVNPNSNCNVCSYCTRGDPHFCKVGGIRSTTGIWKNGGWSRFCKVGFLDLLNHLLVPWVFVIRPWENWSLLNSLGAFSTENESILLTK